MREGDASGLYCTWAVPTHTLSAPTHTHNPQCEREKEILAWLASSRSNKELTFLLSLSSLIPTLSPVSRPTLSSLFPPLPSSPSPSTPLSPPLSPPHHPLYSLSLAAVRCVGNITYHCPPACSRTLSLGGVEVFHRILCWCDMYECDIRSEERGGEKISGDGSLEEEKMSGEEERSKRRSVGDEEKETSKGNWTSWISMEMYENYLVQSIRTLCSLATSTDSHPKILESSIVTLLTKFMKRYLNCTHSTAFLSPSPSFPARQLSSLSTSLSSCRCADVIKMSVGVLYHLAFNERNSESLSRFHNDVIPILCEILMERREEHRFVRVALILCVFLRTRDLNNVETYPSQTSSPPTLHSILPRHLPHLLIKLCLTF
jgi:hypothetical protein